MEKREVSESLQLFIKLVTNCLDYLVVRSKTNSSDGC